MSLYKSRDEKLLDIAMANCSPMMHLNLVDNGFVIRQTNDVERVQIMSDRALAIARLSIDKIMRKK